MKKLIFPLLMLLGIGACKKEESPQVSTKTSLLTARPWRLTAFTRKTELNGVTATSDAYAQQPVCRRDDFLGYKQDRSLVLDAGIIKCNPADPQTEVTQWKWEDQEASITNTTAAGAYKYELLELTATTLRLRYTQKQYGGWDVLTEEWTYTAL
jgi:hypothetical protein